MKKVFGIFLAMLMPLMVMADTYPSLWKKVTDAQEKDLPKTQVEWLDKIIAKAQQGAEYGQLLKAQMWRASVQTQIAPDSANMEIARLEEVASATKDPVVKAVYATVLGTLYRERSDQDGSQAKSKQWFELAMRQPALLAQHKCEEYAPAVEEGIDSKIFNDDLLHVVGMQAEAYEALRGYYAAEGNRAAACISACLALRYGRSVDTYEVRRSKYLQAVDSLIHVYGDLSEAGELAIEHYQFLKGAPDATTDDRVNYINYALNKWGEWPRMNILRNEMSNLRQSTFNINVGNSMLLPEKERLVRWIPTNLTTGQSCRKSCFQELCRQSSNVM